MADYQPDVVLCIGQAGDRYSLVILIILAHNALLLQTFVSLGLGLLLAKICTEIILFLLSYRLQQNLVFG